MKKIIILALALVLLVSALVSCSNMTKMLPGSEKEAEAEIKEVEETEPASENEEVKETEEVKSIVLSDYLGDWHPSTDVGNIELRILSTDTYSVEFSLWFIDSGEINNVYATVNGNTASFDLDSTDNTIAGVLVFEENVIKCKIKDSRVSYLNGGTLVFDGKHSSSYQDKANAEKETAVPETPDVPSNVIAPTYFTEPFDMHVNTPNNILYLREGPAKSFEGIEKMPHDSLVEINGFNSDRSWAYVYYYSKGVYGWCSIDYLVY